MLVVLVIVLHFLSHLLILLVDGVESLLQLLGAHPVVLLEDLFRGFPSQLRLHDGASVEVIVQLLNCFLALFSFQELFFSFLLFGCGFAVIVDQMGFNRFVVAVTVAVASTVALLVVLSMAQLFLHQCQVVDLC
uniref:Uncharacterized protein n=1 Tax=Cacopsylla melanoneura TaxID=428564 RepID=A0A8D8XR48_9HEMI